MKETTFFLKSSKSFTLPKHFSDYENHVKDVIDFEPEYNNVENIKLTDPPDFIICEDTYDTINILVKSAKECSFVNVIFIFDDLDTFESYYTLKDNNTKPKLLSLDFMFNSITEVHESIINRTSEVYESVKKKWKKLPVIGVTNFKNTRSSEQSVDNLIKKFESNGDAVYDKKGLFTALHQILDNVIIADNVAKLRNIGNPERMEKGDLIDQLNALALSEMVDYSNEKIYARIINYLNIQERIIQFAEEKSIRLKTESLAASMLFYENNVDLGIDVNMLKELYNMNKASQGEICKKYNIPPQPLPPIKKYFTLKDEDGLFKKEAKIIFAILKENKTNWPKTVELAKSTSLTYPANKINTFLDHFVKYVL